MDYDFHRSIRNAIEQAVIETTRRELGSADGLYARMLKELLKSENFIMTMTRHTRSCVDMNSVNAFIEQWCTDNLGKIEDKYLASVVEKAAAAAYEQVTFEYIKRRFRKQFWSEMIAIPEDKKAKLHGAVDDAAHKLAQEFINKIQGA